MRAKTVAGRRLQKLVEEYAQAKVDLSWAGTMEPHEAEKCTEEYLRTWKTLIDAVDEVTS